MKHKALTKSKKNLSILLFLLISFSKLNAQDFMIVHDMNKDTSYYLRIINKKDTQKISEIAYKTLGQIRLKVENFNPFYYNARVSLIKRPPNEETSQLGMFISGLAKAFPVFSFPDITDRGPITAESKSMMALYDNINEVYDTLGELKYEKEKTGNQIKQEAKNAGMRLTKLMALDSFDTKAILRKGKELDENYDLSTEKPFSKLLSGTIRTYEEIRKTNFWFLSNISADPLIKEIKLQIFPRSDSFEKGNDKDTITKFYSLRDRGYIKLRNSVGIAFTYFTDKNRSYYIKPDLTIAGGKGDWFTPVISTFINFYGSKTTGLKWGGTFGFGFPVTGKDKEVNFFLGLCSALGRNEAIYVSGGLAGTRIERLAEGWEVGQTVPNLSFDIPTLMQYRIGGFLSINFNLSIFSMPKINSE